VINALLQARVSSLAHIYKLDVAFVSLTKTLSLLHAHTAALTLCAVADSRFLDT